MYKYDYFRKIVRVNSAIEILLHNFLGGIKLNISKNALKSDYKRDENNHTD